MDRKSTPDLSTDVSTVPKVSTSSTGSSPAGAPQALATVAVVGLGTMGTGIAEILTRAGREVIGIDIDDAAARRAVAALEASTT
ncbi:3-hydroxyacyl-CoA dehydrogenase NAD-binding domain-containing protein, partial [Streptomyces monomycini]